MHHTKTLLREKQTLDLFSNYFRNYSVRIGFPKTCDILPEFIAEYSGDTLWAAMVYCGIRFLFPSLSILKTIVISLLFSYCIEISQLYQADWANTVRNTTLGALIFGHGFLWSDMICYTVGVSLSAVIDSGRIIISQKRNP